MSWFSEITGMDAANNAGKQASKNRSIQNSFKNLFDDQNTKWKDLQKLFDGLNVTQGLGAALNDLNAGPEQRVQKFSNRANETAANAANQQASFLKSQGFGDGLVAGQGQAFFQNAANQTNQYEAQQMDPQEQMRRAMALLQAWAQAEGMVLDPLQAFASGVYGAPQQAQGGGLLGGLGQLAGLFAAPATGGASFLSSLPGGGAGITPPSNGNPFYR